MAVKRVEIEGIGTVVLLKRRGARSVRLSIAHNGEVRVTLPSWAPYKMGADFASSRTVWIQDQRPAVVHLQPMQRIGKAHQLVFMRSEGTKIATRIVGNEIRILMPAGQNPTDSAVQAAAEKAAIRTLKKEATSLLPHRLEQLASEYGFTYQSVGIKQLKGRWGSCSEKKDIVLNCFLMQLPWHLIDYVLIHELVHTRIMAHGPVFWAEVGQYIPNLKAIRQEIKTHKPVL